jgi:hypothetical protein
MSEDIIERLNREIKEIRAAWAFETTALRAENGRIKAAFRVNMLRAFPNMSHEEIDAEIEAAIRE